MPLQPNEDTFYIKQGETVPIIQAQLTNENGEPMNLEDVETVIFRMKEPRGEQVVFQRKAMIANQANGVVRYSWNDGDTDEPGRYRAEFIIRYPSGRQESFPNMGYRDILVGGAEKSPPIGDELQGE